MTDETEKTILVMEKTERHEGTLIPVRTLVETRAATETIDVYTVSLPAKRGTIVINALREILPPPTRTSIEVPHYRRLVKEDYLPERTLEKIRLTAMANAVAFNVGFKATEENIPWRKNRRRSSASTSSKGNSRRPSFVPDSKGGSRRPSFTTASAASASPLSTGEGTPKRKSTRNPTLHLMIAPTSHTTLLDVYKTLRPLLHSVEISTLKVPLHPPVSQAQAETWSLTYWPTVYKRVNPFGPHPPFVEQTIAKILPKAAEYMAVAREAAMSVSSIGGYEVGCAVISPDHNEVVIVAGDGRKRPWTEGHDWGNPLEHAVMRAVGLVATKRKIREGIKAGTPVDLDSERFQPQTEVEKKYFHAMTGSMGGDPAKDSSVVMNNEKETGNSATEDDPKGMVESPTGYLCHNHILYLTHEPCVMCSMALLHSRIGLVIFDGANKACEAGLGGLCSGELDSSCPVSPIGPLDDETAIESSTPPPPEKKEHNGEYGLFWRKELNWKFLVYEWREKHQNLHQSLSNSGGGEGLTEELEDGQVSGIALLKKLAQLDVSECKIGRDVHA